MPTLIIKTDIRKDPLHIKHNQVAGSEIVVLGRLPHGMKTGNSSIAIYAQLREILYRADGSPVTVIFAETSLSCLEGAMAAFAGAEQRDRVVGGN